MLSNTAWTKSENDSQRFYSQLHNNIIMILFIPSESRPPTGIKIKAKPVLEIELSFMFSKIGTQALLVSSK